MPYEIRKSGDGFKVFKTGTKEAFSNEPMSKEAAKKQMAALYANTDDIQESFIHKINRAFGITEGVALGAAKGPQLGVQFGPNKGSAGEDPPADDKKKKKKTKIEDEVLEAG